MHLRNRALLFRTATVIAALCSAAPACCAQQPRKIGNATATTVDSLIVDVSDATLRRRSRQAAGPKEEKFEQLEQTLSEVHKALDEQRKRLAAQERRLTEQVMIIGEQGKIVKQQRQELESLRNRVLSADSLSSQRGTGVMRRDLANEDPSAQQDLKTRDNIGTSQETRPEDRLSQTEEPAESEASAETQMGLSGATGGVPSEEQTTLPEVVAIPELGGVLTPRTRLVLEPALQYSHSSFNRFTFLGVEIIEAFLIGLIQAEDSDRDLLSPQLTARYGITDRLELEAKVPYVYRSDELSATIPQLQRQGRPPPSVERHFDGDGLGDIEVALHYQVNRGLNGWPFFVGNVRWKSDTGEGPFDVDRDAFGAENESPTGSGFHSIEPSLTALYPSDPAVLFANIGYLINLEKDVDKTFVQIVEDTGDIVAQTVGNVDPGNGLRVSFGMGYSLNERTSLTLGYKHDFIDETDFQVNGVTTSSEDLDVGSLLLGWGFSLTNRVATNLNLELGITQDAPDVLLTLRVPVIAHEF